MSKNTNIREGGIGRQFTENKLRTNLVGGNTCLWVPKDEVHLGTKNITENGTYKAKADDLYGYSQVTVNVQNTSDTITGKDPVTGQEKVVGTDPTTGEIVETVVPTEIRVITPPTNPYGTYVDGQTITKDGMVVKAYDANGNEMQTVPIGELTLAPAVAVYDESKDTRGIGTATSDLIGITVNMCGMVSGKNYDGDTLNVIGVGRMAPYIDSIMNESFLAVSATQGTVIITETVRNGSIIRRMEFQTIASFTYDGKTVYYDALSVYMTEPTGVFNNFGEIDHKYIAWTMLYGDIHMQPSGSAQTITVSWPRPGDGKVLATTFDILVGPRSGQGDD